MEAALLQVYAPRDPLAEAIRGDISVRQLRVMVAHLPAGSAYHRARQGPWTDGEYLLHDVDSRLRDVVAQLAFQSGLLRSVHRSSADVSQPTYIPVPGTPTDDVEVVAIRSEAEAAALEAVMTRTA